ncbi:hypothetical protein NC652_038539 [Populus alba x Populus x berolinensis]|uniref:Uncharacterized protein n=1 Tax=Populus alba x Populus x berolinensis TaxID=444605 RepID=A0AAD6LIK5_9ROSI|nr:hypothetical protein NC652_038539 [Populus alba x Populus x berolinensis]KAJ6960573.1 hypothetical protein NC653_038564 [Populus alba x Populus x berolinensis]
MIFSRSLLRNPQDLLGITRSPRLPRGRSRLLSGWSCLESWLSMLFLRELRLSLSSPVLD